MIVQRSPENAQALLFDLKEVSINLEQGITFRSPDGDELTLCIENEGFAILYNDNWYHLKNGKISNPEGTSSDFIFTAQDQIDFLKKLPSLLVELGSKESPELPVREEMYPALDSQVEEGGAETIDGPIVDVPEN